MCKAYSRKPEKCVKCISKNLKKCVFLFFDEFSGCKQCFLETTNKTILILINKESLERLFSFYMSEVLLWQRKWVMKMEESCSLKNSAS